MTTTTFRTDVVSAMTDLLFTPGLELAEAVDRHFAPDYCQRTDGRWDDRSEFTAHIAHLRGIVAGGSIRVLDELVQGDLYADRHIIDVDKTDGSSVRMEVYLFGEFAADGRFRRIEETTLMLQGADGDRNIGSAR
ncbi:nuclear transport factor 2 family protein [Streptomyces sp. BHT-5-2]|uniref:nuclear transport factor 2 family protein n=1 Tax=Streptomyces sp. BHT-5-2 TaxID=2866715 RepID=UPI001C8D90D4|nr:nuclear transport factor 2 family protein [Streptomyces sp. BHT-5-2]QZL04492.1 nuclear transport factor 2 family protein [Streptomyces sp. BHT-5-2]